MHKNNCGLNMIIYIYITYITAFSKQTPFPDHILGIHHIPLNCMYMPFCIWYTNISCFCCCCYCEEYKSDIVHGHAGLSATHTVTQCASCISDLVRITMRYNLY